MGIYLRGRTYWARWCAEGVQRRRSLGTSDRRQAEQKYAELVRSSLSVREVLRRWFEYQKVRCKPRSLPTYRIIKKRFSLAWGDLRPAELTTLVVEEFQETALQVGLSPRTINNQIQLALSAIKWAHDRGLIDTGPPKWKRLRVNSIHARKYLTGEEITRLLKTVREPRWQRLEVVVMLALYSGLRQQEIAWLT